MTRNGCATGTVTYEIAGSVNKILGIDFSSKMINAANGKSVEHKLENIEFAKSTIFDKRYNQEPFDVVFAFNILHLIENTQKVLQRINELLKPGGVWLFPQQPAWANIHLKSFYNS